MINRTLFTPATYQEHLLPTVNLRNNLFLQNLANIIYCNSKNGYMIDQVVKAVTDNLNEYINVKFSLTDSDNKVIVSNLINQNGAVSANTTNKIICSLINIEQERIRSSGTFKTSGNSMKNAPVNLDLYLMFSSNYVDENYMEGLKFLSVIVNFFQGKSIFTPQNTPDLPSRNPKITFSLFNVDLGNLSHLWGALGAKYMPSVIYQVRMISFFDDRMLNEIGTIKTIDVDIK